MMTSGYFSLIVFTLLGFSANALGADATANPTSLTEIRGASTTNTFTTVNPTITTMTDDVLWESDTVKATSGMEVLDKWYSSFTMEMTLSTMTRLVNRSLSTQTGFPTSHPEEFSENANKTKVSTDFSWNPIEWSWVIILQLISAIVGIVGNFLVITVLFQRRRKSRSTDTLIGGLACADFLTSVFLIPVPRESYVPYTWVGEVYCRVIHTNSLLWISITASTYLLMSLSVELFIAVVYPLRFKDAISRRRISMFIIIVWLLSVLSGLFVFVVYTVDESSNRCKEQYMFIHAQTIVAYYWFCLRLVVPCLTMLVTQTLIARELSLQSRNFKGISSASGTGKTAPSFHVVARNRVLKMTIIIILIYVVCWSPNQIAYLGYNIGWVPESYLNSPLHRMLTVLGFYNSCANPVIYTARYPEFRKALRDIFTCTSPKNAPLFD